MRQLIQEAVRARENAYCPYSGFAVGAALLAENGEIFTGCNIENGAFTPTCCAERVAFFKAVSRGVRKFKRIVVVGGKKDSSLQKTVPCGVCLQVMAEFCNPENFEVVLAWSGEDYEIKFLKELLPCGFQLTDEIPEDGDRNEVTREVL